MSALPRSAGRSFRRRWVAGCFASAVVGGLFVYVFASIPKGSSVDLLSASAKISLHPQIEAGTEAIYEVRTDGASTTVVVQRGSLRLTVPEEPKGGTIMVRAFGQIVRPLPGSTVALDVRGGMLTRLHVLAGKAQISDSEKGTTTFLRETSWTKDADPAMVFAVAYARVQEDASLAAIQLEEWLFEYPEHVLVEDALFWAGVARKNAGEPRAARKHFQRYLTVFPNGRRKIEVQGLLEQVERAIARRR